MHFDNAHPHNSPRSPECLQELYVPRVPHRAYRLERAPSHFFLFGDVKSKLPALANRSREALICEIQSKLDLINDGGTCDLKAPGKPIRMFREHTFSLGHNIQAGFDAGVIVGIHDPLSAIFHSRSWQRIDPSRDNSSGDVPAADGKW
jgi:hypothetical protein